MFLFPVACQDDDDCQSLKEKYNFNGYYCHIRHEQKTGTCDTSRAN